MRLFPGRRSRWSAAISQSCAPMGKTCRGGGDKEEALVQSALARIRRAQEKGKREVKLNKDELAALENRRKRMQSAATSKERKDSGSGSGSEKKRRSDKQLFTVPIDALEPST